jgi:outer membrane lipoprotein-sorting protein
MSYVRSKRARFAAPVAVLAAVGVAAVVPTLSGASAPPNLPAQSAQQLVADVVAAKAPQLSGGLAWTANLGLSDLSSLEAGAGQSGGSGNGFDPLSLLSGNYQLKLWLGAKAEHIALIEPTDQEVDVVRNRNEVWLWDSSTQKVVHIIGPAKTSTSTNPPAGSSSTTGALTPMELASRFLDHVSANTSVTPGPAVYVAGQPAYQLLLGPKGAPGSTIRDVEIAVGASGPLLGVPLQVAIYANGQASPALELGFTGQLNVGAPAASELTFTPPPGSSVTTHTLGGTSTSSAANGGGWIGFGPLTGTNGPTGTGAGLGSGGLGIGGLGSGGLSKSGTGWATVVSGPSGQLLASAEAGPLSAVTTVVNVHGQQGRLFGTSLLNVLLMPNGRFYAGLVTPSVLEASASANT